MDFPPGFMDEILRYQKSPPSSRMKERRVDLEIFSGLFDEVTKLMPLKDFMNKLMYCNNDDEKIDLIKPFLKWTPSPSSSLKFKKSSETCLDFCKKVHQAHTMIERMKMVNMMFAFAEDEGDLALANFMRYLYLKERNDYIGALEAIKNVVKSPVLPKSQSLFEPPSREDVIAMEISAERKVKESSSGSTVQIGKYRKEIEERKEFMKNLFTIKNPNPVAPSLEDFVEIKCNSSHGRHLVVNKDVPIGTTILVEKPAVAALFQDPFNLDVVHCHHCFKKNFKLIPCPNCVFALFCDEKCMKEATNYHQYECAAFPDLHTIVMGFYSIFIAGGSRLPANWVGVFKLISSLGPKRLFEIFQQEKNKQNDSTKSKESNEIPGLDPVTKIYDPNSYETICHLFRYFIKGTLFPSIAALCLVKILEIKSSFFEKLDIDSETKLEFQDFLTKRMLYHFESFRRNSFVNDEVTAFEGIRLEDTKRRKNPVQLPEEITTQELGQVIYPTASLFSHSCHPNVERFNKLINGEVTFVTLRSVKKGEELCFSYGPHYSAEGKQGRQEHLNFYNFKCDCVACVENWPTTEEQSMMNMAKMTLKPFCPPLCCSGCYDDLKTKAEGNLVAEMKKRKMNWSRISLTFENGFKCSNCNKKYSQASLGKEYNTHEQNRIKIKTILSENRPLEAIDLVKKACDFYDRNCIPPTMYASVVNIFQHSVLNIIHFSPEY